MTKANKQIMATWRKRLTATIASALFSVCPLLSQINTDQVIFMGRSALASSDYLTAIHYFNQVIEAKPFLWEPYYFRAYTKFILDDYTGAEEDCTKSINANPFQIGVYQLRGLCRIRLEQYDKAAEDYTKTIAEKPQDEGALYNRGLCHLQLKEYDKALKDIDTLLKFKPNFYRAYAIKAQISLAQKDTVQGINYIDKLLKMNPENADGWSFKGRYALEKKRYEEADSCLSIAIKLQPNNYECYLARALARHGMNLFGDAIADYDKTISLVPQHFVAHYNRGLLLALVGSNNKAIDDFSFVINKEPDNVMAIYNRALLRKETGDYRGAAADFTKIIRQFPNFTYGYYARAECRRKYGDVRGALNDESVVARANLDMFFGKSSRRYPVKRWRQNNDHSLDKYQELVEDADNDSTGSAYGRMLSADLFGRVQNKATDKTLIRPFLFTFNAPVANKRYRSVAFVEQAAEISQKMAGVAPLEFSAEYAHSSSDESQKADRITNCKHFKSESDSLFAQSVIASDRYDYPLANKLLQKASDANSNAKMKFVFDIQKATILYFEFLASQPSATPAIAPNANQRGGHLTDDRLAAGNKATLNAAATILKKLASSTELPNQYALYNLGCIEAKTGDTKQAIKHFSEAIKADKMFAEAYYNRGLLLLEQGEKDKARQDLSKAGELGLYKAYAILKGGF